MPQVKRTDGFPRRNDLHLMTALEFKIHELSQAIEGMPAHPSLTDAVIKLGEAREHLADYVDAQIDTGTDQEEEQKDANAR